MRFSVGNVVRTGVGMWLRSLWRCGPVIGVGFTPALAMLAYVAAQGSLEAQDRAFATYGKIALCWPLLELPVAAVVSVAVIGDLRGQRRSLGACVRAGLRRLPQVGLVTALIYLALLAVSVVMMLPLDGINRAGAGSEVKLLVVLLWLALVVLLTSRWWLALPAAVVERPGILGALRRSQRLTRTRRGRVAALVASVAALHLALLAALSLLGLSLQPFGPEVRIALLAALMLGTIALTVLRAALAATAYALIVDDVEGDSPERLGEVFA